MSVYFKLLARELLEDINSFGAKSLDEYFREWFTSYWNNYVNYDGSKYTAVALNSIPELYFLYHPNIIHGELYYNTDTEIAPTEFSIRDLSKNLPYWRISQVIECINSDWDGAYLLSHPQTNNSYVLVSYYNRFALYRGATSLKLIESMKRETHDLFTMPKFLFELRGVNFAWLKIIAGPGSRKMHSAYLYHRGMFIKPLEDRSKCYIMTVDQYDSEKSQFSLDFWKEKYLELAAFAKQQGLISHDDYQRTTSDHNVNHSANVMMNKGYFHVSEDKTKSKTAKKK